MVMSGKDGVLATDLVSSCPDDNKCQAKSDKICRDSEKLKSTCIRLIS